MKETTGGTNGRLAMWIPIAALVGAAAGAAIALLYAPKDGRATRQYIRDKAVNIKDQARETAKRVSECMPWRRDVKEKSRIAA